MLEQQIKKGYKQTELGIIPEDWKVGNILDDSTLKARIGWQGLTTAEYRTHGKFYLVTGTDFKNGKINWDTCVFVDKERFDQDKHIQLKIGDVLITKDGTIGKIAYVDSLPFPATLNTGVFVIRSKNNNYLSLFLYYILTSSYFKNFLTKLVAGSTINHIYQKDFVTFSFVIPKITEQEKITRSLFDIDELIKQLDHLIVKKKNIQQGVMTELLTGKTRLKGFSEEWENCSINSLCKLFTKQTGFDYTAHIKPKLVTRYKKGVIPFIQNKDFQSKKTNFKTDYYIPENVAKKFPRILLDEKCLLISISGSVGKVGIFSNLQMAFVGGAVAVAKFINKRQLEWVMYYLLSNVGQNKLFRNVKAGSHKNLILADLREIKIPLPSEKEQFAIVSILSDLDSEMEELRKNRDKYIKLKEGMMQKLLTGEIRLK
jgi:type I restriction enzyme, S subunit